MNAKNIVRKKEVLISIILGGLILLSSLVGMNSLASLKKSPEVVVKGEHALRVHTLTAAVEAIPMTVTGYGEVSTLTVVPISSEVAGRIEKIHPGLEAGEVIPAGELLFEIDSSDYDAAVQEAAAMVEQRESAILRLKTQLEIERERLKTLERNRELAGAEFERIRELFSSDSVGTRSGVDRAEKAFNAASDQADQMVLAITLYPVRIREAESGRQSALARLRLAEARLERCRVTAPFDGRVKTVSLERGQYVSPGQPLLTLADDSVLEILVPLDSRDARQWLRFTESGPAEETPWFSDIEKVHCRIRWTENDQGTEWAGRLHRVVKFDRQTRTLTLAVRVSAAEASRKAAGSLPLVEGMFCSVAIPGRILENAFRLPREAVTFENTVHVSVDNRLRTVPVTVAAVDGDFVYLSDGLSEGDVVITTRLVAPLENTLLDVSGGHTPPAVSSGSGSGRNVSGPAGEKS